ncbi:MAG: T9SS type A sorting domain-containing protein [Bacteroidota bacterium]
MPLRFILALLPLLLSPYTLAQNFAWQYTAGPTAPINQFHLYVDGSVLGVSDSLLYRSGDDGLSWQQVATAPSGLSELHAEGARLWGLSDGQVVTGAWLGAAWEVRSPGVSVDYLAVRGDSVFATVRSEPDRIYRSFDAGQTWASTTHDVPTLFSGAPFPETSLLKLIESGLLYRQWSIGRETSVIYWSADAGDTWNETSCGPLTALDRGGERGYTATLPVFSDGFNRWFAGNVLRTNDGGRTCESVVDGFIYGLTRRDDGTVLVGLANQLARLDEGRGVLEALGLQERGAVYNPLELPSGTVLVSTRSFRYASGTMFTGANGSGAYRVNSDLNIDRLTGPAGRATSVVDFDGAVYAGAVGGLFRLNDATNEPQSVQQGWAYVGANYTAVGGLYADEGEVYAFPRDTYELFDYGYRSFDRDGQAIPSTSRSLVGVVGDVRRTASGAFVMAVPQPVLPINTRGRAFEEPGLFRYEGPDEEPSEVTPVAQVARLHEATPGVLYAGCVWAEQRWASFPECPGALVSADDGRTWQALADGLPILDERIDVFAFTTDVTGTILAATRDGVYALEGTAWSNQGLSGTWVYSLHSHPTAGTFAGTERGVFRWDAGAETWQPVGIGLEDRTVYDLLATDDLLDGETVLVAATDRGVFTSAPLVSIDMEDEALPTEAFAVAAYPNPFAEALTVEVALAEATGVRATIYDVLGRVVGEVPGRRLGAGTHRLPVATDGLATGVYLVRVTVAGQPERAVTVTRVR